MNEVVSPTYTLTVYGAHENRLPEENLRCAVQRLLHLARLSTRGEYIFKVLKFHSARPAQTLEFEHTGKDLVYNYRCRIGNIAGVTGIFQAVLRIPDNEGLHSGINDELNRAATKLLIELDNTPAEVMVCTSPPKAATNPSAPAAVQEPDLPSAEPPPSTAPAPAPAASEAAPTPVELRPLARTKSHPKKVARKSAKATKRRNAPSITDRLQALNQLVAEELRKKQSELAELTELQRRIEQLKTDETRRAEALARLKNLS